MKDIINQIKNSLLHHKSIFVYGGWGIGKTHLIKNEFMKECANDYEIIYIDSRIVDLNKDVFSYIVECADYDSNLPLVIKKVKKALKPLEYSAFISLKIGPINVGVSTSKKGNEKDNPKELFDKLKNSVKKRLIIFDELDRITPESVLKILNYFNGLSLIQKKTPFKTMMVGNKEELENILSRQFNMKENGKKFFLEKYFDARVDISQIQNPILMKVVANSKEIFTKWNNLIPWKELTTIGARTLERKYSKLEELISKYKQVHEHILYKFFLSDLFQNQEQLLGKFFSKEWLPKEPQRRQAMKEILEWKSLDRFEEWWRKWKGTAVGQFLTLSEDWWLNAT